MASRWSVSAAPPEALDAYKRLLTCLPDDLGAAIVIVNHHRVVATQLHEILPYYTKMPVDLITEHLLILPNRVFIIPSRHDLHVFGGGFRLKPISKPRGCPPMSSPFFFSHSPGTFTAGSSR